MSNLKSCLSKQNIRVGTLQTVNSQANDFPLTSEHSLGRAYIAYLIELDPVSGNKLKTNLIYINYDEIDMLDKKFDVLKDETIPYLMRNNKNSKTIRNLYYGRK